jgi:hypothetical protein
MRRQLLSVSLAALLLAGGGFAAAQAQQGQPGQQGQQGGPGMMMQQERQIDRPDGAQATGDRQRRAGRHGMRDRGYRHGMMHRGMGRDYGMRGRGGRGGMHAMRGQHREHMLRTLIILMDTDGDGSLSLEEVQAVTERFFNAMDADGDGQLTIEEIRNFYTMRGAMPGLDDADDDVDLDDDDDDDDNNDTGGGN